MTTRSNILAALQQVLEKDHDIPPGTVTPETQIADLGIDSLGMIELIFNLEDRIGVKVDDGLQGKPPATIEWE